MGIPAAGGQSAPYTEEPSQYIAIQRANYGTAVPPIISGSVLTVFWVQEGAGGGARAGGGSTSGAASGGQRRGRGAEAALGLGGGAGGRHAAAGDQSQTTQTTVQLFRPLSVGAYLPYFGRQVASLKTTLAQMENAEQEHRRVAGELQVRDINKPDNHHRAFCMVFRDVGGRCVLALYVCN